MKIAAQIESQAVYHRQLFAKLYEWDSVWKSAVDFLGNEQAARQIGLDQLGHFGPRGVALVAERLRAAADGPLQRIVELGSGFGGVLRQLRRELAGSDAAPALIGVELVPQHCEIAAAITRTMGDDSLVVRADAGRLPFAPESIDAAVAVGSAGHFPMQDALIECARVLRPGGTLVMTEEVSLRPRGAPPPGKAFVDHHPSDVFYGSSPEQRRAELETASLAIETFDSLADWALPLLRQRVQMLRFMEHCANEVFGSDGAQRIIGTLASAADEYERGSLQPTLIVARRAR